MSNPTKAQLLAAVQNHMNEVYGQELGKPDFILDIELYQSAGLLPADYEGPTEDDLDGTIYQIRKCVNDLLAVAEPIGERLLVDGIPFPTTHLGDTVRRVKERLRRYDSKHVGDLELSASQILTRIAADPYDANAIKELVEPYRE